MLMKEERQLSTFNSLFHVLQELSSTALLFHLHITAKNQLSDYTKAQCKDRLQSLTV